MQRYNPPTTSAQMYCTGCQRQIRKVQQVMDEKYMENIYFHVEKNKLETRLAKTQRELEMERCKVATMNVLTKGIYTPEEKDQQVKELMDVNKKLTQELQKVSMAPMEYPLEEWHNAIDSKWREQYNHLKEYAIERKEEVEEYKDMEKDLKEDIYNYRQEVNYLKRLLMSKNEEIEELKEAAEGKKKAQSMPTVEKEEDEEKLVEVSKASKSVSTDV